MAFFAKLVTAVVINAAAYIAREKVVPVISKKIKDKIQELKDDLKEEEEVCQDSIVEEIDTDIENSQKEIFAPKWDKEL